MGAKGTIMKKKILVSGPALTRSGYGEMTRFALRALRQHEDKFDIYLNATKWGNCGWIHEDNEERAWLDSLVLKTSTQTNPSYDISIQSTIPPEFKQLAPVNIGYTAAIETNKISPHWIQPSNLMNKIIVLSEFGKKGYENGVYTINDQRTGQQIVGYKTTQPVVSVGFPTNKVEPKDVQLDLVTDFNFLVVAQAGPRKNIGNTISWFMQEFKDDANVGLVCKTHIAGASQIDREVVTDQIKAIVNANKDSKCKVYVLHGDMTDAEMAALYTHSKIKALISLTHGEGFGLPLFEASYYGLPVITTDWSSQSEFLYCPNKEGKVKPHFVKVDFTLQPVQQEALWQGVYEKDALWAFPNPASAKTQMREVYKNHDRFRGQAKRLMEHNVKTFTNETMYDKFMNEILSLFKNNKETYEVIEL